MHFKNESSEMQNTKEKKEINNMYVCYYSEYIPYIIYNFKWTHKQEVILIYLIILIYLAKALISKRN